METAAAVAGVAALAGGGAFLAHEHHKHNLHETEHRLPNGLIHGKPLDYKFGYKLHDGVLLITFKANADLTGVLLYPTGHIPACVYMTGEGSEWRAEVPGYNHGDNVELYFCAQSNGTQADNVTEKHQIRL